MVEALAVALLPKGMTAPDIFNETRMIDVNTSARGHRSAARLIKTKIYSSEEWEGRMRHEEDMRGGDGTKLQPPSFVQRHTPPAAVIDRNIPPF